MEWVRDRGGIREEVRGRNIPCTSRTEDTRICASFWGDSSVEVFPGVYALGVAISEGCVWVDIEVCHVVSDVCRWRELWLCGIELGW